LAIPSLKAGAFINLTETRLLADIFIIHELIRLKAVNEIKEFCYRVNKNGVLIYDVVHAGLTVLYDDETFHFFCFDYFKN
jgi:chloramphenicol O-acetyltransferase